MGMWDLSGNPRFNSITTSYFRGAHGLLLGYDITSRASFEGMHDFMEQIKSYCDYGTIVVLVGHKLDLEEEREVSTGEGEQLAKELGSELGNQVTFYETSAKTGENIEAAMTCLVTSAWAVPRREEFAVCRMLGEVNGRSGFEAKAS